MGSAGPPLSTKTILFTVVYLSYQFAQLPRLYLCGFLKSKDRPVRGNGADKTTEKEME